MFGEPLRASQNTNDEHKYTAKLHTRIYFFCYTLKCLIRHLFMNGFFSDILNFHRFRIFRAVRWNESTTRNLLNRSSGVKISWDIRTRLARYLYSTNKIGYLYWPQVVYGLSSASKPVNPKITMHVNAMFLDNVFLSTWYKKIPVGSRPCPA